MIWERKACLSHTASHPHLSFPETMMDGCVQRLHGKWQLKSMWEPYWRDAGRWQQQAGCWWGVWHRWLISSLCLVNIVFMQVGAIFSPPSPLPVMTITPAIDNIGAMPMSLTSSQKHSFLFASGKGEILSKLQLLKLSAQLVSKCQGKLHTVLSVLCLLSPFHPHGPLHKSFPKIKSSEGSYKIPM